jgi:DNA repair exonuclease SbcCD ATPase subunit
VQFESKENEGRSTEFEAELRLPVMSAVEGNTSDNKPSENNYDGQDNFDETKQSEGKPNIQGGQVIVPDTTDPISKENSPMDLSNFEDESDEDPFAELESILMGSPESSPKATCSTIDDVAVRESLHNLECLLENSLESILCDIELQQQLHTSLECIKQATHEKVYPNVVKLVQKMTSFIQNLSKNFVMTKNVVDDHINALQKREKLVQLMRDGKKQKKSMMKDKSQFEVEAKRLEEVTEKVDEKIRILVEQKKSIELEKTKLKESMERCEGEKKKLEDEAKNMISESKELMSSIKKSKTSYDAALSKQQKMKDKWEGFRVDFADNYGSTSS